MHKLVTCFLAGSALAGCGHKTHSATPAVVAAPAPPARKIPAGVALFDGSTLAGWSGNPAIWSVKAGAINGTAEKGNQLLLTDGDYADFRLVFKSRLVSE